MNQIEMRAAQVVQLITEGEEGEAEWKDMVRDPVSYVIRWYGEQDNQWYNTKPFNSQERALRWASSSSLWNKAAIILLDEFRPGQSGAHEFEHRWTINRDYEIGFEVDPGYVRKWDQRGLHEADEEVGGKELMGAGDQPHTQLYSPIKPAGGGTVAFRVVLHQSMGPRGEWVVHYQNYADSPKAYFIEGFYTFDYADALSEFIKRCNRYGLDWQKAEKRLAEAIEDDPGESGKEMMGELLPGPNEVEYSLERQEEDIDFRKDFEHDPRVVRWIERQLDRGNEYAWFCARVVAKWFDPVLGEEVEGDDYLGGCSYKSAKDFMHPKGYWPDMKKEAYRDLIDTIRYKRKNAAGPGPDEPMLEAFEDEEEGWKEVVKYTKQQKAVAEVLEFLGPEMREAMAQHQEMTWENPHPDAYDWQPVYDDDLDDEGENPWREVCYYPNYSTTDGMLFKDYMEIDRDGNHDFAESAEVGTVDEKHLEETYGMIGYFRAMKHYWEWVIARAEDPLGYIYVPQREVEKRWIASFAREGERLKLTAVRRLGQQPAAQKVSLEQAMAMAQQDENWKRALEYLTVDENGYPEATEQQIIEEGGEWNAQNLLIIRFNWTDKVEGQRSKRYLVKKAEEGLADAIESLRPKPKRRRRRQEEALEKKSDTLVVHIVDPSTDFLKVIYEGLGFDEMRENFTADELMEAIKTHERIFMVGHGCPTGIFGPGFLVDARFAKALAEKKDGVYVWCNADAFAHRHGLSGLVSGMFISEVGEAAMFGIKATQEEVDRSNMAFSIAVRRYLDTGAHPSTVRQCYSNAECKITTFNSERLYVFDRGQPTPPLHPSSARVRELEWEKEREEYERTHPEREAEWARQNQAQDQWDEWMEALLTLIERSTMDAESLQDQGYDPAYDYMDGMTPEESLENFARELERRRREEGGLGEAMEDEGEVVPEGTFEDWLEQFGFERHKYNKMVKPLTGQNHISVERTGEDSFYVQTVIAGVVFGPWQMNAEQVRNKLIHGGYVGQEDVPEWQWSKAWTPWTPNESPEPGVNEADEGEGWKEVTPEPSKERWVFTEWEEKHPENCTNMDEFETGPINTGSEEYEMGVLVYRDGEATNRWADGTAGVGEDILQYVETNYLTKPQMLQEDPVSDRFADAWHDVYVVNGRFAGWVPQEPPEVLEAIEGEEGLGKELTGNSVEDLLHQAGFVPVATIVADRERFGFVGKIAQEWQFNWIKRLHSPSESSSHWFGVKAIDGGARYYFANMTNGFTNSQGTYSYNDFVELLKRIIEDNKKYPQDAIDNPPMQEGEEGEGEWKDIVRPPITYGEAYQAGTKLNHPKWEMAADFPYIDFDGYVVPINPEAGHDADVWGWRFTLAFDERTPIEEMDKAMMDHLYGFFTKNTEAQGWESEPGPVPPEVWPVLKENFKQFIAQLRRAGLPLPPFNMENNPEGRGIIFENADEEDWKDVMSEPWQQMVQDGGWKITNWFRPMRRYKEGKQPIPLIMRRIKDGKRQLIRWSTEDRGFRLEVDGYGVVEGKLSDVLHMAEQVTKIAEAIENQSASALVAGNNLRALLPVGS